MIAVDGLVQVGFGTALNQMGGEFGVLAVKGTMDGRGALFVAVGIRMSGRVRPRRSDRNEGKRLTRLPACNGG